MIKKISYCFLFMLVFSVYPQKEKLPVISTAEKLKGVTAKKIIWEKDGAKMVQIPYGEKTYDRVGNPVSFFYGCNGSYGWSV